LVEIIQRRRPELVAAAARAGSGVLLTPERELLGEVLIEELTARGLDAADEPTGYGLVVEDLLDWLRTA